jgi:hypothetical protein
MAQLTGETPSDWAKRHGVPLRTVRRWRQQPAYQEHLAKCKTQVLQSVVAYLISQAIDSAKEMVRLRDNSDNEMVRLGASKALFHALLTVTNYAEVQDQLALVLDRLAEIKGEAHDRCVTYPVLTSPTKPA